MGLKKQADVPDPLARDRALLGLFVDAYETGGRGLGAHHDALAEALWRWGDAFTWKGVLYRRETRRSFVRMPLVRTFHRREAQSPRDPMGRIRRARDIRKVTTGRFDREDRE